MEIGPYDVSYISAGRVFCVEIMQDVCKLYGEWFEKVCEVLKIHGIFKLFGESKIDFKSEMRYDKKERLCRIKV